MLENKCKYYAQIFGGVINTAYLCPIIHTKKCDKMNFTTELQKAIFAFNDHFTFEQVLAEEKRLNELEQKKNEYSIEEFDMDQIFAMSKKQG